MDVTPDSAGVGQRRGRHAPEVPAPRGRTGGGLVRRRVIDALEPGAHVRVGLLTGPQGSGKTTALAQWSAATASPAVVLPRVPGPGDPDGRSAVADALAHGATVLALDDADRRPSTVRLLRQALVDDPSLRLVLTGRTLPQVDLAREEVRAVVLPADVLRFREHEVDALLRDHHGLALEAPDVERLTRHTEGWAAGLHLFHDSVATSTPAERARAVAALGGRVSFAWHYLQHQVLGGFAPDVLPALRASSPLEALTPGRGRQLLGRDVEQELRALDGCSLVSSPDAGATRVVHPLVRAHLLTQLRDEVGDARADALLRAAARMHLRDGEVAAAARSLARAQAWDELDVLVGEHGARLWTTRDVAWVADLPEDVVSGSASLRLARAVLDLHAGRLHHALVGADAVAASASASRAPLREVAERVASAAATWLDDDQRSRRAPHPPARTALTRPVDVLYPATSRAGADADAVLGSVVAHLLRGDASGARRAAQLSPASSPLLDLVTAVLLGVVTGLGRTHLGNLRRRAGVEHRPWLARAVDALDLALDHALDHAGGRADRDSLLRRTRECDEAGDPWGAAAACAIRATALLAARQPDVPAYEELCDRLRLLGAPALEAWARAGLALASATADLPDAQRDAEAASALGTACQLPAVVALAHVASAADRGRRVERLALARAEAATVGFDLEPWVRLLEPATATVAVHERVPPLVVRCFGRFELVVDGEEPPLHRVRPRARELLRLLAAQQGRPVHRETLLVALWPDLDARSATHNLHVAISALRTCLEPGSPRGGGSLVVRRGDHYQLAHPAGTQCDLTTFDTSLAEATARRAARELPAAATALERALEHYRGDLLPEDGPAEWVVPARDLHRVRAGDAAGDLADVRLEVGDPAAAAVAARRSVELSPWRDASWRTLHRACLAAGDLAAAERARADYRRMLASLGVPTR